MALLGGFPEQVGGLPSISGRSFSRREHHCQVSLGADKALLGGLTIPVNGLDLIP